MRTHSIETEYLSRALDPEKIKTTVDSIVARINESGVRFTAIVFTGTSGALIAPIVAFQLGKFPIVVRKDKKNSHSWHDVEGFQPTQHYDVPDGVDAWKMPPPPLGWHDTLLHQAKAGFNYIIIDDQVCSGASVRRMHQQMKQHRPGSRCLGVFLYDQSPNLDYEAYVARSVEGLRVFGCRRRTF